MKAFTRVFSKIKDSAFWTSVAVLVSGVALSQLIGLFTTPIVSRLYNPAAYGEYAIIVSTASIVANVASLGLGSAIMVAKTDEESEDVFVVSFFSTLFLATLILGIMLIVSPFRHFFDFGANYLGGCFLVYGFVITNSLSCLLNIYINRKRLNRVLFYNSLISSLATLFITIPLGILKSGSIGLLSAYILSGIIANIQMIYHSNPFRRLPRFNTFISVYKNYKNFILYQYPSNFIGDFAIQIPTQVFSSTFGNANLGSYSMNEKILGIPSRLIGTPINTIYFRTASEYSKEGKNLEEFTYSLVTKIMLLALIPILITVIWGQEIFKWVLGTTWGEAGRLAGFLIVQYVFMFCENCTSYCRVAIGKQRANLLVSILRVAIVGLSIFLGIKIYGDLFNTIIFFTVGSSLYLIIDMAINFYCMGKYHAKYTAFATAYIALIVILWMITK